MNVDVFESLPDNARLWIYAFEKPLAPDEERLVRDRLSMFMQDWHSHNVDVNGAFEVFANRFVIVTGASRNGLSGCSIDSIVQNFKAFRDEHGLDALDRGLVHYRSNEGAIEALDRASFKAQIDAGRFGPDTPVFDLTIQTLSDLRAGRFERPLAETWHARAFLPAAG